jgi:acyl-CoA synthetase (AMP-forming)/AMP-acid ligase II
LLRQFGSSISSSARVENIYSKEIEDLLCEHPAAAEVAVVAAPVQ